MLSGSFYQSPRRSVHYVPEFRDPFIDEEYYCKHLMELTEEEKYDQELKKTSSKLPKQLKQTLFVDLVISKFTRLILK